MGTVPHRTSFHLNLNFAEKDSVARCEEQMFSKFLPLVRDGVLIFVEIFREGHTTTQSSLEYELKMVENCDLYDCFQHPQSP